MTIYDLHSMEGPYGSFNALTNESAGISAGDFLAPNGSAEATVANFKTTQLIEVGISNTTGQEALICGIALDDRVDNEECAVATRGIFLLQANEAITIGTQVCQIAAAASMKVIPSESGGRQLGIALTGCNAQDEYVLVLFQLGMAGAET